MTSPEGEREQGQVHVVECEINAWAVDFGTWQDYADKGNERTPNTRWKFRQHIERFPFFSLNKMKLKSLLQIEQIPFYRLLATGSTAACNFWLHDTV